MRKFFHHLLPVFVIMLLQHGKWQPASEHSTLADAKAQMKIFSASKKTQKDMKLMEKNSSGKLKEVKTK